VPVGVHRRTGVLRDHHDTALAGAGGAVCSIDMFATADQKEGTAAFIAK